MTNFDQLIVDYRAAHDDGDTDACQRILDAVEPADFAALTQRLDAEGLGRARATILDDARMTTALEQGGMSTRQASSLSILSTGSFPEYVRDRMAAIGMGADTLLRDAIEQDAATDIDDGDEQLVRAWIAAVVDGDDEPDIELPEGADALLATALGATEQTVMAVRER